LLSLTFCRDARTAKLERSRYEGSLPAVHVMLTRRSVTRNGQCAETVRGAILACLVVNIRQQTKGSPVLLPTLALLRNLDVGRSFQWQARQPLPRLASVILILYNYALCINIRSPLVVGISYRRCRCCLLPWSVYSFRDVFVSSFWMMYHPSNAASDNLQGDFSLPHVASNFSDRKLLIL
jgi:hypothetical protein